MTNRGITPPDPTTDVGLFRLASGDVESEPLNPAEPGYGDYALWSDDQITAFLTLSGGSVARAISKGYIQLAAATDAEAIKTDDLSYIGKEEVEKWERLAAYWTTQADLEGDGPDDIFDLVVVGGDSSYRRAEAAPWRHW